MGVRCAASTTVGTPFPDVAPPSDHWITSMNVYQFACVFIQTYKNVLTQSKIYTYLYINARPHAHIYIHTYPYLQLYNNELQFSWQHWHTHQQQYQQLHSYSDCLEQQFCMLQIIPVERFWPEYFTTQCKHNTCKHVSFQVHTSSHCATLTVCVRHDTRCNMK
jgi:hypothetical protein